MQPSFETLRAAMVDSQLRPNGVTSEAVVAAFGAVPREAFAPPHLALLAYLDRAIDIAPGRAMIEPMQFGALVEAAAITPADRVLLVGAARGYEAAVLARLAGEVIAVEEDPDLAASARAAGVAVVEGSLADGWPAGAPYDLVLLNGGAERLPAALVAQLAEGGRIVAILIGDDGVGRTVTGVMTHGALGLTPVRDAAAPVLPGFARPRGFVF